MTTKEIIDQEITTIVDRIEVLQAKQREFAQALEAVEAEMAGTIIPARTNGQQEDLHGLHLVYRELEERLYLVNTESNELMARLEDLEQEASIVERMEDLAISSLPISTGYGVVEAYA